MCCSRVLSALASCCSLFFFNVPAPTEIYTLSLHDALPIYSQARWPLEVGRVEHGDGRRGAALGQDHRGGLARGRGARGGLPVRDRKSTRLNSSHEWISYAVFCLKKKKKNKSNNHTVD